MSGRSVIGHNILNNCFLSMTNTWLLWDCCMLFRFKHTCLSLVTSSLLLPALNNNYHTVNTPSRRQISLLLVFDAFISTLPASTMALMTLSSSFPVTKQAVWREMAPAAAARHRRGRDSLCRWPGNWNSVLGAPCWHFHQWKNPSWKICQQGNNSASKFVLP